VIGLLIAFALNPWITQVATDRLGSIAWVVVGGVLYTLLTSAMGWRLTLHPPERAFILKRLQPLLKRLRLR